MQPEPPFFSGPTGILKSERGPPIAVDTSAAVTRAQGSAARAGETVPAAAIAMPADDKNKRRNSTRLIDAIMRPLPLARNALELRRAAHSRGRPSGPTGEVACLIGAGEFHSL